MAERDSNRSPKAPGRWGRMSRGLSFWLLLFLIPAMIYQLTSSRQQNNIDSLHIVLGERIEGKLRQPIAGSKPNQKVNEFWTEIPRGTTERILTELETQHPDVKVGADNNRQNYTVIFTR